MDDAAKEALELALKYPRVIKSLKEYQDMTQALLTVQKFEEKYGKCKDR